MKVLVTGANGYIGSHLIPYLCDQKYNVIATDFINKGIDSRAEFIAMDILNKAADTNLYQKLGSPDIVIHMAWKDGFNHNSPAHLEYLPDHYAFIKNMIDSGVKSISIMGTMHEVGYHEGAVDEKTPCNPLSLYGIAKNALRQAVLAYAEGKDTQIKWLRAFYVTGDDTSNKSIFAKILQMASEGKKTFPFTTGLSKYDFIDISTLVEYIGKASVQTEINGIINVCSGKPVSLKEKVETFIKERGLKIQPEYGMYPSRQYDSPAIWGNNNLIQKIMEFK